MKSLILYGSQKKLTNGHHKVTGWKQEPDYYIRTVMVRGDAADALERAKPMEGETVLNTVPLNKEAA